MGLRSMMVWRAYVPAFVDGANSSRMLMPSSCMGVRPAMRGSYSIRPLLELDVVNQQEIRKLHWGGGGGEGEAEAGWDTAAPVAEEAETVEPLSRLENPDKAGGPRRNCQGTKFRRFHDHLGELDGLAVSRNFGEFQTHLFGGQDHHRLTRTSRIRTGQTEIVKKDGAPGRR